MQLSYGNLAGNVNADPMLLSGSTGNLQLQAASPAIDHGVNISGLNYDVNGIIRPQGTGTDIGAYEYDQGNLPPVPPAAPKNLRMR